MKEDQTYLFKIHKDTAECLSAKGRLASIREKVSKLAPTKATPN